VITTRLVDASSPTLRGRERDRGAPDVESAISVPLLATMTERCHLDACRF
jgi:hypothetical protein